MAISTNNLLTAGMSGDMAGQFVFKYYRERDKTVVSKKPNMDGVVPSEKQLKEKSRFAEAIRFAQGIINAAESLKLNVPLVVRLEGTNVERGKQLLNESRLALIAADDLADAAQKVVAAAKNK